MSLVARWQTSPPIWFDACLTPIHLLTIALNGLNFSLPGTHLIETVFPFHEPRTGACRRRFRSDRASAGDQRIVSYDFVELRLCAPPNSVVSVGGGRHLSSRVPSVNLVVIFHAPAHERHCAYAWVHFPEKEYQSVPFAPRFR